MDSVVLNVNHVSKKYGHKRVVDDVSFEVTEGEIFGFLGPNGAGKSTTIKMICGLTSITQGDISICGYSVKSHFEQAASFLGGIIENPELYNYMSGLENLKYFATLHPNVTMERIKEVVQLVGLQNRIRDKVRTYSLGMKQRLGIAQAILHSPKLIILDEPTNGLDASGITEMRTFLKKMAKEQKVAVLVSSHILTEMEMLCDRIAIINNGKIAEHRSIKAMQLGFSNNFNQYIKVDYVNFAGKLLKEKFGAQIGIAGNKVLFSANENQLADFLIFLTKNKISIYGAGKINITLEDLFMNVVGSNADGIR